MADNHCNKTGLPGSGTHRRARSTTSLSTLRYLTYQSIIGLIGGDNKSQIPNFMLPISHARLLPLYCAPYFRSNKYSSCLQLSVNFKTFSSMGKVYTCSWSWINFLLVLIHHFPFDFFICCLRTSSILLFNTIITAQLRNAEPQINKIFHRKESHI